MGVCGVCILYSFVSVRCGSACRPGQLSLGQQSQHAEPAQLWRTSKTKGLETMRTPHSLAWCECRANNANVVQVFPLSVCSTC